MKKLVRKNIVKRKVHKRRAKFRSIKKKIKTISKASTPHDFEGMLISHVKTDATLGGTTLPYLLFESSIPMRELAYRHGITIGRELFHLNLRLCVFQHVQNKSSDLPRKSTITEAVTSPVLRKSSLPIVIPCL